MQQVCLIFSNTVLSHEGQHIFEIIGFSLPQAGDVSVVSLKVPNMSEVERETSNPVTT